MILTDQEISLMAHNEDEGDWNDLRFKNVWHEGYKAGAKAAEAAVLKKLASAELPEPAPYVPVYRPLYTADQLRQAYAQGAASQLSAEPVASVKSWTNGSYWRNYQLDWHKDVPEGTELYTRRQA